MATPPIDGSSRDKVEHIRVRRSTAERMGRKFKRQGAETNLLNQSTPLPPQTVSGKVKDISDILVSGYDCSSQNQEKK